MIVRDSEGVYDPTRINEIPIQWLANVESILDVGCNDGTALMKSEYATFFKTLDDENKYLGIDVMSFEKTHLKNIIHANILSYEVQKRFDCVLCMHVLEHIPFRFWSILIERMKARLNSEGRLIIGVPYNEPHRESIGNSPQNHLVFEITEKTFKPMLSNIESKVIVTENRFNGDGARLLWSHLRWLIRTIKRHPYRRNSGRLLLIWRNEEP